MTYRRDSDKGLIAFFVFWTIALAVNLAIWGVIIWAIIKIVSHVTG